MHISQLKVLSREVTLGLKASEGGCWHISDRSATFSCGMGTGADPESGSSGKQWGGCFSFGSFLIDFIQHADSVPQQSIKDAVCQLELDKQLVFVVVDPLCLLFMELLNLRDQEGQDSSTVRDINSLADRKTTTNKENNPSLTISRLFQVTCVSA